MSTSTDYAYRAAAKARSKAMATRLTPAGKFWTRYMTGLVLTVSFWLAVSEVGK